ADKQHAFRDCSAEPGVFFRVFEEIDDLLELSLGLVDARHVGEGDVRRAFLGLVVAFGPAATEPEWSTRATELTGCAGRDVEKDADQQQRRAKAQEQCLPPRPRLV